MISVVIPSRAEGRSLLAAIDALSRLAVAGEIIVAAHGESDAVRKRAAGCTRLRWVECPRACRGEQLALGAEAASGDVLLFLHTDTRLPSGASAAIEEVLGDPLVVAGGFRLSFDARHPALELLSRLSASRWHISFLGDQGFFVRREVYQAVGGFRPYPLFEDIDLAGRLAKQGRLARLPVTSLTSARRFLATGPWRQLAINVWLVVRYLARQSPERLARRYRP